MGLAGVVRSNRAGTPLRWERVAQPQFSPERGDLFLAEGRTFDPVGVAHPASPFGAIHILSLRDKALYAPV